MKIPFFRRFNPMDYPQFNSADGEKFLEQLNSVLEPMCQALNGNLGVDNMNCEIKEFDVDDETEYEINLSRVKGPVRRVSLLNHDYYDYPNIAWEPISESEYKVKISFDSAPESSVRVRLLFEGD